VKIKLPLPRIEPGEVIHLCRKLRHLSVQVLLARAVVLKGCKTMNESPSAAYQFDHTPLDVCVLDPSSSEGQNVENFVGGYLIVCYDPFSRLIEKTFFSTVRPNKHNIRAPLSTSTLRSESS
jgi:hypothetical protein